MLMSSVGKSKTRSSTIFEVGNESKQTAESVARVSPKLLGIPLVDFDLPGDEVSVMKDEGMDWKRRLKR